MNAIDFISYFSAPLIIASVCGAALLAYLKPDARLAQTCLLFLSFLLFLASPQNVTAFNTDGVNIFGDQGNVIQLCIFSEGAFGAILMVCFGLALIICLMLAIFFKRKLFLSLAGTFLALSVILFFSGSVGHLCSFHWGVIGPFPMLSALAAFVVCSFLTILYKRFRRKKFIALAGGFLLIAVFISVARSFLIPFRYEFSEEYWRIKAQPAQKEIAPANDAPSYKPVIYLYPDKIQEVTVKLDYKGELTVTYPRISSEGWKVTAHPGGKLLNSSDKKEYSYLFWEGNLPASYYKLPDQGFVVPGEQADLFLQEILAKAGLTPVEYNEFIVFWYPLIKNYPYVQIAFAGEEYDKSAPLSISPTPDSMLRVFLYFKRLSGKIELEPQNIPTFERTGFTVVEWGGSIIP